MAMPEDEIVVTILAGPRVTLSLSASNPALATLTKLGFASRGEQYSREIASEEDRIALIKELIGMDALFEGGSGWSPAELVGYYQDRHLVHGDYLEITWRSPTNFILRRCVQAPRE